MDTPNPITDYLLKEGHLAKWALDYLKKYEKIKTFPNVGNCLDKLRQAGADPEMVLTGIILMYPGAVSPTKNQLKALRTRIASLANRLERIYQEVEATVSDPLTHSSCWRVFLLEKSMDFTATEKSLRGARYLCNGFKVFVNFFRAEAKALQEIGHLYETASSEGLGPVLRYVKQSTGQFHDECMADLLQAAHDALGVEANFTGPKLRKLRQRKFPDVIKKRRTPSLDENLYGGLGAYLTMPLRGLDKSGS